MSVEWEGLDTWISKVAQLKERVPKQAEEIMSGIGKEALDVMESNTPVWEGKPDRSHQPGKLKEGDTLTPVEGGFELSNAVEYSVYVEKGTRKMSAEPYLEPATEFAAQAMADKLPKALE